MQPQHTNDPNDDPDGAISLTPQQREQMIAENVASIEAVPAAVWAARPYGAHNRTFALHWARLGYDCYAYASIAGTWNLWLDGERVELGRRLDGITTNGATQVRITTGG